MTARDRLWAGSMPAAYDRWLAPTMFRPFAVDLARRVARSSAPRVMEMAAGTGVLTEQLAEALPTTDLVATDLNTAMVAFGSQRVPAAKWVAGDACRLPLAPAQFGLVVCQFGVMFFPDKPAAFAEVRRVLAPRGRLLFSTWGPVATHAFAAALVAGLERALPQVPPFVAAVPHGYFDHDQVVADLRAGGMACESVESVTLEGRATSAADVAIGLCTGTPVRAAIEAQADLAEATATVVDEMVARLGDGPVAGSMTALVYEARPDG